MIFRKFNSINVFNVATCFFALNDFTYSDISEMLKNIKNNIKGQFIVIFFDYKLFNENIHSPSIVYKNVFIVIIIN